MENKGQVSIFVIVAIIIVAGIAVFFAFRGGLGLGGVPTEFAPIYSSYISCIETEAENALDLLGTQGGRLDVGEFVQGSEFAPFSSHINFLGIPVQYWFYISGNGIVKENVPSRSDMEREVENYLVGR